MVKPLSGHFPSRLLSALVQVEKSMPGDMYVSGGTVRDLLLERSPSDLDITVAVGAEHCCKALIDELGEGAFVQLGTETEEAARVVWQGYTVDFSSFRKNAENIEEELGYRDFTINSMAMRLSDCVSDDGAAIIDPLGGREHLVSSVLHHCPEAFADDPLRMLRGFRLQAELGFTMSPECSSEIVSMREQIQHSAAERILYELDKIMATSRAAAAFSDMAKNGLLWQIIPELYEGVGVEQPRFHHKDVFFHNLLALECIERVIEKPQKYFNGQLAVIEEYLSDRNNRRILRWSSLLHDLGKPATRSSGTIASNRTTFYNHDRVGRELFEEIALRLRMSKSMADRIGTLIEMHMHPFHLSNTRHQSALSRKALLKICKKAGDELAGLFVLAMADSLAGQGELKPADMEERLADLFAEVTTARQQFIQPVLQGERLVTGHDLIKLFNLEPGPLFAEIFSALELAQVEEEVKTRDDALRWLRSYLEMQ